MKPSAIRNGIAAPARLRVLILGAHPDDPEESAGGTAAKYADGGHAVLMVSLTNGDAGHQSQGGARLAARRAREARRAGAVIGADDRVLGNPDGELLPTLENRRALIRLIRGFRPDIVFGPRPGDYHPDHRAAAVLLQDAAALVTVPNIEPRVPALDRTPVIMHVADRFRLPRPFRPDVAVDITEVVEKKLDMLDCHESQMYEWLPFHRGHLGDVPRDRTARRAWLGRAWEPDFARKTEQCRKILARLYGPRRAAGVRYAEGFECSEYGAPLTAENLGVLFPFFGRSPKGSGHGR